MDPTRSHIANVRVADERTAHGVAQLTPAPSGLSAPAMAAALGQHNDVRSAAVAAQNSPLSPLAASTSTSAVSFGVGAGDDGASSDVPSAWPSAQSDRDMDDHAATDGGDDDNTTTVHGGDDDDDDDDVDDVDDVDDLDEDGDDEEDEEQDDDNEEGEEEDGTNVVAADVGVEQPEQPKKRGRKPKSASGVAPKRARTESTMDGDEDGNGSENDVMRTLFPQARIRSILKQDTDLPSSAGPDVIFAMNKAVEHFVGILTREAYRHTRGDNRKTLTYRDVALGVRSVDRLAFLEDVVPPLVSMERALASRAKVLQAAAAASGGAVAPSSSAGDDDGDVAADSDDVASAANA